MVDGVPIFFPVGETIANPDMPLPFVHAAVGQQCATCERVAYFVCQFGPRHATCEQLPCLRNALNAERGDE